MLSVSTPDEIKESHHRDSPDSRMVHQLDGKNRIRVVSAPGTSAQRDHTGASGQHSWWDTGGNKNKSYLNPFDFDLAAKLLSKVKQINCIFCYKLHYNTLCAMPSKDMPGKPTHVYAAKKNIAPKCYASYQSRPRFYCSNR
jgi:hypothetical protein